VRALLIVCVIAAVAFVAVGAAQPDRKPAVSMFRGHSAGYWNWQLRTERKAHRRTKRSIASLRRAFVHRPSSREALRLASVVYGVPYSELLAVSLCETGGTLDERTYNGSSAASGLLQFLPSTFRRTPFGGEDIFSPYANALAAGWLWRSDGRSFREWVCKP